MESLHLVDEWGHDSKVMRKAFERKLFLANRKKSNPPLTKTITELPVGSTYEYVPK